MSRLDQHIGMVRFRLMWATFVTALPWAIAAFAAVVALGILVQRAFIWHPPRPDIWLWIGGGLTLVVPMVYAIVRRPNSHQAAVAIDERLGLKEKFSTALYVRSSNDPFAAAAVRDAEQTATSVNLHNQFPLIPPNRLVMRLGVAAIVLLCGAQWLVPQRVAAEPEKQLRKEQYAGSRAAAEHAVRQALAEIDNAPRQVADNDQIKMAREELSKMLQTPIVDSPRAKEKAQDTLNQINALKKKVAETNKFVKATEELAALKDISPPSPSDTGPVSDAQRAMSQGKLEEAINELKKAVDDFPKADKKDQQKAAEQMKNLAQQIAKNANDPKVQQQIQQQLQQAGASKQQAQQMQKLMQQAANGNQQAAQQLQQMANQAIQQANQQAGMSQQQQKALAQAMQQAVQQGQQKANGQANAQQMAQAAQNLAQAMQQAAQGGQQGQQGQGQKGQQAQANAQGQQGQGQQGQKNGQGQGQGQQNAQQQMQQQIAQMQAMAKDAQAVAAGQQLAQQGQGQGQGQQGQGQGQGQGQQQANGQFGQGQQGQGQQQGNPQQQGQGGQGGAAIAAGGKRPDPVAVPFQVKQELSASETIESGKIIASSFVKAPSEKGESKMKLTEAIASQTKEEAGEVETDRIPRGAQKAVKDYFDTLKSEPGK